MIFKFFVFSGFKDLADFLPAYLVTIASYFSAKDTRGIWKPTFMIGTDWISLAENLALVEQQIKKILVATTVDVASLDIDKLVLVSCSVFFWILLKH